MATYFRYRNASRRLKVNTFSFSFEVVDNVGGAWVGVLALEDPVAVAALRSVAERLGIAEIDQAAYDSELKKKSSLNHYFSSPSPKATLPPQENAGLAVIKVIPLKPQTPITSKAADHLIKTGVAEFSDPQLEARMQKKRGRKPISI